jgi:hypothetical protein
VLCEIGQGTAEGQGLREEADGGVYEGESVIPYCDTGYYTEFKKLGAIVGMHKVKNPDKWLEWDRLVDEFGWDTVLAAARRCHPDDRWANGVEKMCMELRRLQAVAEKQAAQDAANAEIKARPKGDWKALAQQVKEYRP